MVKRHTLKTFLSAQEYGINPLTGDVDTLSDILGFTSAKVLEIRKNLKELVCGYLIEARAELEKTPEDDVLKQEVGLLSSWKLKVP